MKRLASLCVAVVQAVAVCYGAATGTEMFDAVRAGDTEKVKALLLADPRLTEARTEDGSSALHLAALEGQTAVARLLLASQAQVNARGLREETPLHMATYDGHREVAELLLASQADVNARNTAGETALHLAARKGFRGLVELLLEHHAEVNAKDRQESTALHAAAAGGHKDMVELLVSQNADLGARDNSGRTPKSVAAEKERWEIVALLTPRVGEFYDLQRFVFDGAKTFPAEALRQALKGTHDFFEISHPLAPQEAYLEATERKLLLGYQHHGFPETHIQARHDVRAGRIVVKVVEGPRYVCGGVKVTGSTNVPAAAIIQRLMPSQAATQSVQQAFEFQDKAPATNPLTEASPGEPGASEALWVKGEPAPFSDVDLRQMKAQVTDVLRESGFLFPEANVRVVPDKTAPMAELQVEVLEEGPRGVIDRIEVTGNGKNTAEAVLRYLDLKPGMELSSQLLARTEDRLWRAARFLTYKVSLGSPDTGGRVPLQIQLVEYDKAPPLDKAFSRMEEVMLKLREWLSRLDKSGEEMIVNLTGFPAPTPEVEVVLSPLSGIALLAKGPTRPAAAPDDYALVLKAGLAGLYSPAGGRKLLMTCSNYQLRVVLSDSPNPSSTNENKFTLNIAASLSSLKKAGPASPSYRFELELPPVACIGLAHWRDCTNWFEGDTLIRSNATLFARFDTRTGRILEFRRANNEGSGTVQVRFVPGTFESAIHRIEAATAGLQDVGNTNVPLSSAAAFLGEEVLASKYLEAFLRADTHSKIGASLPTLLRQLRLGEILAPLDQLVRDPGGPGGGESFWIPEDAAEATSNGFIGLLAGWLLQHSDEIFAAPSWAWTLLREACFTVQGKGRYTDQALTEIYESSETGPLGYLAVAQALRQMQPPLARKFAARGLEQLSTGDFRRDCRLFLTGDAVLSQCCQRLAAALRELDAEQVTALAKMQSPVRGEFIRACARRLRVTENQSVMEVLAPALDSYWEGELKEQVATALGAQAFDPVRAFKEGLTAYQDSSPDKSQAAKLLAQAAAHGHAGAQYYLAMIYERGAGVPKDVAAALNWYRQSATNGYVEAGVTLGNFYTEGLAVEQDYAEAYVWYSVAAAQGHRLAEVFRNSARRKLTAPELAKAEKRAAAILASRPNASETGTPSPGTDH